LILERIKASYARKINETGSFLLTMKNTLFTAAGKGLWKCNLNKLTISFTKDMITGLAKGKYEQKI
jgi:hypothetical protein